MAPTSENSTKIAYRTNPARTDRGRGFRDDGLFLRGCQAIRVADKTRCGDLQEFSEPIDPESAGSRTAECFCRSHPHPQRVDFMPIKNRRTIAPKRPIPAQPMADSHSPRESSAPLAQAAILLLSLFYRHDRKCHLSTAGERFLSGLRGGGTRSGMLWMIKRTKAATISSGRENAPQMAAPRVPRMQFASNRHEPNF
jgi:hypothetical protein